MNKKLIALVGAGLLSLALAIPAFAKRPDPCRCLEALCKCRDEHITTVLADSWATADTGNNHEDISVNVTHAGRVKVKVDDGDRTINTGNAEAISDATVGEGVVSGASCGGGCGGFSLSRPMTVITNLSALSTADAYTGNNSANVNVGVDKAHGVRVKVESGNRNITTGDAAATSNATVSWVVTP